MSDLINRQAAIDALWSLDAELRPSAIDAILNMLNGLPSAQPEIKTDGDMISRAEAIEIVNFECGEWEGLAKTIVNGIKKLPTAQPETNYSEFPNNSDLISRQDAIDALDEQIELCNKALGSFDISTKDEYAIKVERASLKAYREQLKNLTSAQPERKTGRWIKTARWGRVYYCDQCRNYLDFNGVNAGRGSTNFCPNCGAKMENDL